LKLIYLVIILVFFQFSASAQDTLKVTGSEVIVESKWVRTDSSRSSERFELSEQRRISVRNTSLDEVIRTVPGILSFERNNLSVGDRISIRGSGWQSAFGVRGIRLYYEGMPLTGIDGQTMTELVDPQRIQAVSLIKGASASLFGNSSGGAILLESSFQPKENLGFKLGSFGLLSTELDYAFADSNDSFYHISQSISKQSGYRNYSEAFLTRLGIRIKTRKIKDWWFTQSYYVVRAPELNNPGSLNQTEVDENPRLANPANVRQNAGKSLIHIAANYSLESQKIGEFRLFAQYRELDNPLAFSWINLDRFYSGISYDKRWKTKSYGTISVLGDAAVQFDKRINAINRNGFKGDETVNQQELLSTVGIGFKHEYNLTQQLRIENAIRFDATQFDLKDEFLQDEDQSGNRSFVNPGYSGTIWFDSKFANYFVAFKTAYDLPTTTELTNRPDGKPGFNADLKPESHNQYELGLKGSLFQEKTNWSLNVFHNQINAIKIGEESSIQAGRTVYKNAGEARITGLEWALNQEIFTNQQFHLSGSLMQTRLNDEANKETQIPGLPAYMIKSYYEFSMRNFTGLVEYQGVGKQFADSENQVEIKPWQIVSSQIGFTRNRFIYFLRVSNIFDEKYSASVSVNSVSGRYFEPASSRNWTIGIRFS